MRLLPAPIEWPPKAPGVYHRDLPGGIHEVVYVSDAPPLIDPRVAGWCWHYVKYMPDIGEAPLTKHEFRPK
jgi:hypothetical protein